MTVLKVDIQEIRTIGVFAGLAPKALQDCARTAVRRPLVKGDPIFHQGDQPARFHALLSGWVRVLQAGADGELSVIRFVGPGELFGAFAIFTSSGYPADAVAAEESVELSWSEGDIRELMDRHGSIAVNLVMVAATRLAELQERVREISTQPAEQRIANALLRLAVKAGEQRDRDRIDFRFPVIRKDVAAMSRTTLYTASRIMSSWEREGIITAAGRRISIARAAELRRRAGIC